MSKSFLNNHTVRGLRNNNPGNLVRTRDAWKGKVPFPISKDLKFEQFETVAFGLRALFKDLIHDINKGKNTVTKLITEFAPKSENDTQLYINKVCRSLNVKPNDVLTSISTPFLILLARSILKVELGNAHVQITDSDLKDGLAILGDVSTPLLTVKLTSSRILPFLPAVVFCVVFFCLIATPEFLKIITNL